MGCRKNLGYVPVGHTCQYRTTHYTIIFRVKWRKRKQIRVHALNVTGDLDDAPVSRKGEKVYLRGNTRVDYFPSLQ